MKRGLFVVLEGVEGSGKSTQARLLGEWLTARGVDHVVAREPGGTQVGEEIRRALLHGGEVPSRTELLLMLAARAAFVDLVVRPALERGAVVVADRYELSTFAYQGFGRGLGLERIRPVNHFATDGVRPDVTLLFRLDPEEGAARRASARLGLDRIEGAGREFHDTVAKAYALLSETEPGIEVIEGAAPPDAVHDTVIGVLRRRFPETFGAAAGLEE